MIKIKIITLQKLLRPEIKLLTNWIPMESLNLYNEIIGTYWYNEVRGY